MVIIDFDDNDNYFDDGGDYDGGFDGDFDDGDEDD